MGCGHGASIFKEMGTSEICVCSAADIDVLLLLLLGQRGQTVWLLDTQNIMVSNKEGHFVIGNLLKTPTQHKHHIERVGTLSLPP